MLKPIIKTNLKPLILHWIGDSDIDKSQLDIKKYLESGDCVVRPGGNPSKITLKELTYNDILFLYDFLNLNLTDLQDKQLYNRTTIITVARLAIMSIEGLKLQFESKAGHRMLAQDDTESLMQVTESVTIEDHEEIINLIDWIGGLMFSRYLFRRQSKG